MGAVPSAFQLRSLSFERSWRFVLVGRSFNCIVPLPVDYILAKMLAVSRISKRMEKQKLLPLLEQQEHVVGLKIMVLIWYNQLDLKMF